MLVFGGAAPFARCSLTSPGTDGGSQGLPGDPQSALAGRAHSPAVKSAHAAQHTRSAARGAIGAGCKRCNMHQPKRDGRIEQ